MPGPYGVTPTGFNRPTLQELVAQFEADQYSEISATLDASTSALIGQLNGIYARQLDIAWEAIETAYHGFDPDRAEYFLLTALAKLTGTTRRSATPSEVALQCGLDVGTTLEAGTHYAHIVDHPDVRWTPKANFTAPSTGTHSVPFVSEQLGAVQASSSTITVIATTVVGWNSVTNPSAAVPGHGVDDDATLRERREDQLTRAGSSTVAAIKADLSALDGVEKVIMFENWTDAVDGNSLPPKSFEAVVYDAGTVDDDLIAQTILDTKPAGIRSFGPETGTAEDANGDDQTIAFTRVSDREIWVTYTLTERDGYVGDAAFKATAAERLNEQLDIGGDVTFYDVTVATQGLNALVTAATFDFASSPATSTTLPIAAREIARFDPSRIVIV